MKRMSKIMLLSLITGVLMLTACETDGPVENAGESVDRAVEDTGDAFEDAGESVEDAVENN